MTDVDQAAQRLKGRIRHRFAGCREVVFYGKHQESGQFTSQQQAEESMRDMAEALREGARLCFDSLPENESMLYGGYRDGLKRAGGLLKALAAALTEE